jgi:iron(III) transport system permease protein
MTLLDETGSRGPVSGPLGGGPATLDTVSIETKRAAAKKRPPSVLAVVLLVVLTGLIIFPVGTVFYGAFQSDAPGLPDNTFSWRAILEVYTSPAYLWSLLGTLVMAVVTSGTAVILGAVAAWIIARTDVFLRRILEWGIIIPLFISPFIGAIAWNLLGAPRSGMINTNLRWILGLPEGTVIVDIGTVPGVMFVMMLYFLPYAYLLVSSSLRNMDPGLEEASYMNGRGIVATALRVTFPVVRPALAAAFFMIAVLATGIFTIPQVLGLDTGFVPLGLQVYRRITVFPSDPPVAAAIGTLLFWFTLLGIYFYRRSVRNSRRFVTLGGKATRQRAVKLRWARVPVTILVAMYGLLAAVLPYIALILMSLTPYAMTDFRSMTLSFDSFIALVDGPDVWNAFLNTLWIGLLAPTVAVLIALAVSYVVIRERGRIGGIIDYIATFPIAVPGIVFATGMIWLYIRTPLYATVAILALALIAAFMPTAARFVTTGLMQIDPALEEAARMSGAGKFRALFTITVPLMRPAVLSAWTLLFIFASREVNETVLLSGPNSRPLAVLAWDQIEASEYAASAAIGILLTAIMAAGILFARLVFRTRLDSSNL